MASLRLTLASTLGLLAMALLIIASSSSPPQARHAHKHKHKRLASFSAFNYLSIQGPNSTKGYNTVLCGQPAQPQPNQFGSLYCFDMPLLAGRELSSELVGRVQGTYTFVQQRGGGVVFVSETFVVVNNSMHRGTFSAVGLEEIGQYSSKPIVGGTGDFALSSGVAYTTPLYGGTDSHNNSFFWFMYEFTFNK